MLSLPRLHSLLNNLKIKLAKQEKQFREEKQSMAADCERIRVRCKDVQRRMRWGVRGHPPMTKPQST